MQIIKFIYSDKATKFETIFQFYLVTSKEIGRLFQNFVAFLEYLNFNFNSKSIWCLSENLMRWNEHGMGVKLKLKENYNSTLERHLSIVRDRNM